MEKEKEPEQARYLLCERRYVYLLLMVSAGMMGAYTFTLRGGVFCNAQTANVVMMSIAFGQGRYRDAFYFLIPIFAYFFGAFISEILPNPVKHRWIFRWDTCLIAFEAVSLFIIGFIPLSWPNEIVQVAVNFLASMQYNTFRQAEGIPMATTFCTNHVRQLGIAAAKIVRKHDMAAAKRGAVHLKMLAGFLGGGILLSFAGQYLMGKAIWLTLIPLLTILATLAHADLTTEHDAMDLKPRGH